MPPPDAVSPRRRDDDVVALVESLRWQEEYCRTAGSPTAAEVLRAVTDDVLRAGPLADVLPALVRFGDLVGLRVMSCVHLLALERRIPEVAVWLPTIGGTAPAGDAGRASFRSAVVSALSSHRPELEHSLSRTPQTNEPARSMLLRGALSRLTGPVRLFEIGASAGLNLRADHLPADPSLEAGPLPRIVARRGCDLDPVDPATPRGRALLSSYVWVDDVTRFERLRNALEVARRVPAPVVAADALQFASGIELRADTTTVIWHSAVWVYLSQRTRDGLRERIRVLGSSASPTSQLVHVSWEWDSDRAQSTQPFALVLRRWDGKQEDGAPVVLARGMSHGIPARAVTPRRVPTDPLL